MPDQFGNLTQAEFDIITKQYYQNQVPNYQLNTPSLSPNNMASMDAGNSLMTNTPKTATGGGWDPWSIGLTAGMAALPMAGSLLGKSKQYPSGGGGAPGLGMTRGAEVPNVYSGRTNPLIQALLAQYLRRR